MVQVKEHEKKSQLGVLNLPLSRLLNASNMALDQRFQLERSGANSQIKLKATLRVGIQPAYTQIYYIETHCAQIKHMPYSVQRYSVICQSDIQLLPVQS